MTDEQLLDKIAEITQRRHRTIGQVHDDLDEIRKLVAERQVGWRRRFTAKEVNR